MGWSGGSILAEQIWDLVRPYISADDRKKIAKKMVKLFESEDCDTIYECEQLMLDAGKHG